MFVGEKIGKFADKLWEDYLERIIQGINSSSSPAGKLSSIILKFRKLGNRSAFLNLKRLTM
jgi:hypothetical protein